ncbi:MAG: hypothetical protein KC425_18145 [Anaerolineales bacterium]|nr:hypothetical protein [Anaerolineales bacterium]
MPKHVLTLLLLALVAILLMAPTAVFAADEITARNPPGWIGGTLAALSLVLAVAFSLWARRRP